MQYIILISNPNFRVNDMSANIPGNIITHLDKSCNTLEAKIGNENFVVKRDDEISNDFDEDELVFINKVTKNSEFYFVHYRNIEILKMFLQYFADRKDIVIDNDCGLTVAGKEFLDTCKQKPKWDWVAEYASEADSVAT